MRDIETLRELESFLGVPLTRYYPAETISHPAIELSRMADRLAGFVAKGEPLAIEDACRLIAKDPRLPFGKLIKSNLARALRKAADYVPESDRSSIVRRTAEILSLEYCPREAEDYCKLVRRLGSTEAQAVVAAAKPRDKKSKALVLGLSSSGT